MGIGISICSNRVSGIAYILDRFNLSRFINNVVTSKDYPSKPDPTGLLSLIDDTAIFVGDGEIDRKTSHNAGVPFIAYNNPNISADIHIKSHLQILSLTTIRNYGTNIAGGLNGNS
jgi:phosphoglycolate phosphatase-like HAD superfamily hydrolase